ncbi:uncharacterized protein [Aristolochia californica]|uniref:uncharacterized protein n=1 Tax=Aristolochia californica TaxID=171875 RepID=UPI0035DBDF4E
MAKTDDRSTDIFKTIFGASSQSENATLPLFADESFRRKPKPESLQNSLMPKLQPTEKPKLGGLFNSEDSTEKYNHAIEPNSQKKDREKRRNSVVENNLQKSKKRKKADQKTETLEKDKKKRKRDEIEEEYEVKKYGTVEETDKKVSQSHRTIVGEKRKTKDDAAETMVVSAEAYDDESKLQRTVFVGNLPVKVKKKALTKEFKCFGDIESVRIRSVPLLDSKTPRKGAIIMGKVNESIDSVHAYIVFKDEKSAQAALSHNMAEVGGNHIRVDRACPPRKKLKGESASLYDNKRTVFVGNLPFDVKDEELYRLFSGFNQLESGIEAVRVIRDPHTSVGKGIAYVLFKTREAANWVVRKKNIKLRDRDLRLYHSKSDSTPSKRKNSSITQVDSSPSKRTAVASNDGKPSPRGGALSYQGLRAGKSGVQKKSRAVPKTVEQRNIPSKRGRENESKVRTTKRPAVAARKAATRASSSSSKTSGKKRKLEGGTPASAHRNKKVRRMG